MITAVSASAGQVVSAGQTGATLAAGDIRDAVFWLPAVDELRTRQGETLRISLPASALTRSGNKPAVFVLDSKQSRIGGLLAATLVTLTVLPAALSLVIAGEDKMARALHRDKTTPCSSRY